MSSSLRRTATAVACALTTVTVLTAVVAGAPAAVAAPADLPFFCTAVSDTDVTCDLSRSRFPDADDNLSFRLVLPSTTVPGSVSVELGGARGGEARKFRSPQARGDTWSVRSSTVGGNGGYVKGAVAAGPGTAVRLTIGGPGQDGQPERVVAGGGVTPYAGGAGSITPTEVNNYSEPKRQSSSAGSGGGATTLQVDGVVQAVAPGGGGGGGGYGGGGNTHVWCGGRGAGPVGGNGLDGNPGLDVNGSNNPGGGGGGGAIGGRGGYGDDGGCAGSFKTNGPRFTVVTSNHDQRSTGFAKLFFKVAPAGNAPTPGSGGPGTPADRADLGITTTAPADLRVGQRAIATMTVTNRGTAPAVDAEARINVGNDLDITDTAGTGTTDTRTYRLGVIAPGRTVTISVPLAAVSRGPRATVITSTKSDGPDGNQRDNRDLEYVKVA